MSAILKSCTTAFHSSISLEQSEKIFFLRTRYAANIFEFNAKLMHPCQESVKSVVVRSSWPEGEPQIVVAKPSNSKFGGSSSGQGGLTTTLLTLSRQGYILGSNFSGSMFVKPQIHSLIPLGGFNAGSLKRRCPISLASSTKPASSRSNCRADIGNVFFA